MYLARVFCVTVLLILALFSYQTCSKETEDSLKLLHVIFRHGERTPADTYPNDPIKNFTFYPFGWGQLTNDGKYHMYEIGEWLRKKYNDFLGDIYSPNEFYCQTTDVDRTKMSAQLVMAGLWPPSPVQKWGPLDWQPIPIHYEPLKVDNLLLVRKPCPQYSLEKEKIEKSDEIQKIYSENKELLEKLTEYTGWPITNAEDVQNLYGTLRAESDFNLTLPEWTKEIYPDEMIPLTELSYILSSYNYKMQRLKGGVFLKKIVGDWVTKSTNTIKPESQKMYLYGGHDSTISNLLLALKVWDRQIPDYGITIILELHEDKNNNFAVEVFLRNDTLKEPYQLQIPGCNSLCPLNTLIKLTKDVIPENWGEECKTDDPNYVPPPPGGP